MHRELLSINSPQLAQSANTPAPAFVKILHVLIIIKLPLYALKIWVCLNYIRVNYSI